MEAELDFRILPFWASRGPDGHPWDLVQVLVRHGMWLKAFGKTGPLTSVVETSWNSESNGALALPWIWITGSWNSPGSFTLIQDSSSSFILGKGPGTPTTLPVNLDPALFPSGRPNWEHDEWPFVCVFSSVSFHFPKQTLRLEGYVRSWVALCSLTAHVFSCFSLQH
jgi:hypothetical protein